MHCSFSSPPLPTWLYVTHAHTAQRTGESTEGGGAQRPQQRRSGERSAQTRGAEAHRPANSAVSTTRHAAMIDLRVDSSTRIGADPTHEAPALLAFCPLTVPLLLLRLCLVCG